MGALIEEHRNSPLFASRVIASAARQILVAKRTMAMWLYERSLSYGNRRSINQSRFKCDRRTPGRIPHVPNQPDWRVR